MLNKVHSFWCNSAKPLDISISLTKGVEIAAAFLNLTEKYCPNIIKNVNNIFAAIFITEGVNFATTFNRRLTGEEISLAVPAVTTTLAMAGCAEAIKGSAVAPNCFFGVFLTLTTNSFCELNSHVEKYIKAKSAQAKKDSLSKIMDSLIKTVLYAGGTLGPTFGLGAFGIEMPEMTLTAAISIGSLTLYNLLKVGYDSYSAKDGWVNRLGAYCEFWKGSDRAVESSPLLTAEVSPSTSISSIPINSQ